MSNGTGRAKRLIAGSLVGATALTFAPGVADAAISTTAFCTNVPAGQSGFTDLAAADVHQRNVECIKGAGVAQGTTATTYAPTANVTRAQMATFIANMIDRANAFDAPGAPALPDLPSAASSTDEFTDDEGNTHEDNINRLAEADIVQGTGGDNYSPDATVSRAQMATFIAEGLAFLRGADLPEGTDGFTDDETSVHEANINRLNTADIVDGTGSGTFNPNGVVSRAQMASFVVQGMADLNADGFITPVPSAAAVGSTSRPELVSAQVISVVTSGVNAGTTVAYRFDEIVTEVAGGFGSFHVLDGAGVVTTPAGDTVTAGNDLNTLNVRYTTITTQSAANGLVLATVDQGGAADLDGGQNPEGDAPLGSQGATALPAGITNAPDAVSFGNVQVAVANTSTFVDVTFDEAAADNPGFTPVLPAGDIFVSLNNGTNVPCAFDSAVPGNANALRYLCPDGPGNQLVTAAPIMSRVFVVPGAVQDTSTPPVLNTGQAAEGAFSGNTGFPDLVSVAFNLDAVDGGGNPIDSAVLTFDQNVALVAPFDATDYSAYGVNGVLDIVNPASASAGAPTSPTQVVLFFANNALVSRVGLSIAAGAVEASDGPNIGGDNFFDEVGVASSTTATSGGNTTLPELLTVTKSPTLDIVGNPTGGTTYSYAFDEDVDVANQLLFLAYAANGTRFVADACTNDAAEATDHIVRCTGYDVDVAGGTQASNTQLGTFVLGTVDNGAVDEETGALVNNAEGAAVVA